ncbi:hypothetical protein HNP11_004202 [Tsukamurella ocularis]|uniref:MspA family porin n=1 Tax=Tsukamurella ocularis TaxID=1970234 RepID=UPI002168529B|nr:MspA family porin [Tsukamurella ocularis]MCS3790003.1 hypothetical protein [Tsukamurella ocularis]
MATVLTICVGLVGVGGVSPAEAGASPLLPGERVVQSPPGWKVTLRSRENYSNIIPSLSTPLTRSALIGTHAEVSVAAPVGSFSKGKLYVSVLSGCQFPGQPSMTLAVTGPSGSISLDVVALANTLVTTGAQLLQAGATLLLGPASGAAGATSAALNALSSGAQSASKALNTKLSLGGVSAGVAIPLTPGTVTATEIDSIDIDKPGTFDVVVKDADVNFNHCIGYAQARIITWVELKGSNRVQGYLYGQPFSLG